MPSSDVPANSHTESKFSHLLNLLPFRKHQNDAIPQFLFPSKDQIEAFHQSLVNDDQLKLILAKDPTWNPFARVEGEALTEDETERIFHPFFAEGLRRHTNAQRDKYVRCLNHQRLLYPMKHTDPTKVNSDECVQQRQMLLHEYKRIRENAREHCEPKFAKLWEVIKYQRGSSEIDHADQQLWQCATKQYQDIPKIPEFPSNFPWPEDLQEPHRI